MTAEPDLQEPAPDDAETRSGWADRDMGDQVPLLGVPWSNLLTMRTLRGLGLLVLAVVILLWPARSDQVLAVLIGLGMGVVAVTTAWEVIRRSASRRFWRMSVLAVSLGLSVGLVLHPEESLRTAAQLVGIGLLVVVVGDLARASVRGQLQAWTISRSVALGVVAAVLVAFPDASVTAVVVIGAGIAGAFGLGEILTPISATGRLDADAPKTTRAALFDWLQNRPDLAEDRDVLMDKVYFEGDQAPTRFSRFLALMMFASIIASVGVVVESTAVVIGAMLIAPLMVPLMGTAMAVPMGWPRRLGRSAGIAGAGVGVAIATGALVGAILPRTIDVQGNTEILSRISPTIVDLAIAIAAGAAGAYALARRDVSDSLPGVAVAIALVPPLTVIGLCWQEGAWTAGNGALLLFLTNAIAIVLAGGGTFVLVGAAPLDRVSASQQRVLTALAGLFSVAVVIVLLLALNGAELTRTELARAGIDQVMADWSADHDRYRVEAVQVQPDGTIVIDLSGPGEPPDLDDLAASLREAAGRDVPVDITWLIRRGTTIDG